ncbi:MAG: 50S ribosomal protein L32 [Myxococcota bacterium]
MAVPKQKKSKSKRDMRRAQHDKIRLPAVGICDNCGADVLSHRACPECGWYKGREAVPVGPTGVETDEEQLEA